MRRFAAEHPTLSGVCLNQEGSFDSSDSAIAALDVSDSSAELARRGDGSDDAGEIVAPIGAVGEGRARGPLSGLESGLRCHESRGPLAGAAALSE